MTWRELSRVFLEPRWLYRATFGAKRKREQVYNFTSVLAELAVGTASLLILSLYIPQALPVFGLIAGYQILSTSFHIPLIDAVTAARMHRSSGERAFVSYVRAFVLGILPYVVTMTWFMPRIAEDAAQAGVSWGVFGGPLLTVSLITEAMFRTARAIEMGRLRATGAFVAFANVSFAMALAQLMAVFVLVVAGTLWTITALVALAVYLVVPEIVALIVGAAARSRAATRPNSSRVFVNSGFRFTRVFAVALLGASLSPTVFAAFTTAVASRFPTLYPALAFMPVLFGFLLSVGIAANVTVVPRLARLILTRRSNLGRVAALIKRISRRLIAQQVLCSVVLAGLIAMSGTILLENQQADRAFLTLFSAIVGPAFALFSLSSLLMRVVTVIGQAECYFLATTLRTLITGVAIFVSLQTVRYPVDLVLVFAIALSLGSLTGGAIAYSGLRFHLARRAPIPTTPKTI